MDYIKASEIFLNQVEKLNVFKFETRQELDGISFLMFENLKQKLNRGPNEQEWIDYLKRVLERDSKNPN